MEDFREKMQRTIARELRRHRMAAGHEFLEMIVSWDTAASYLDDPDPRYREAALYVLQTLWRDEPRTLTHFGKVVLGDPSYPIREKLVGWLELFFGNTCNPQVSAMLARLTLDQSCPVSLRCRAYEGFCSVQGILNAEEVYDAIDRATDDLPAELDLSLVQVFAAV